MTQPRPLRRFRRHPLALAAAASLATAAPVAAQEAPPPDPTELDAITVTATRRAENVQEVPLNLPRSPAPRSSARG